MRCGRSIRNAALALCALAAATTGPVHAVDTIGCTSLVPGGPACGAEPIGSVSGGEVDRFVANPIDIVTGNKYQRRDDYRAFGSRLAFSRHYNTAQTDVDLGLGRGWRHDYAVSLARAGDTTVRVFQSDGRRIDFEAVGIDAALAAGIDARTLSAGAIPYLPASGLDGYLLLGDGTRWHLPDGRELGFRGQYLVDVTWPDGDRLDLRYRRDGKLASVTDRHDRSLRLEYTPGRIGLDGWEPSTDIVQPGHLERVVLPNGQALEYRYDQRRNLVRVDHAGERIERLSYTDRDHPNHLTGLAAEREDKRWRYDDEGRGDGYAERPGSVLRLEYRPEATDSTGTRRGHTFVRRQDGAWLDYVWTERADGGATVVAVIEHACATCEGVARPKVRNRPDAADLDHGTEGASVSAGSIIAGLTVESLAADSAIVSTDGGEARYAIRFDRRARPVNVESLTGPDGAVPDAAAAREVVRQLGGVGTVDGSGMAYRARRGANCPPVVFRTCAELRHDRVMLDMSICAYVDPDEPCTTSMAGWVELSHEDLGVKADLMHHDNYDARAWRNPATGEVVVAFRGTDDFVADVVEDAAQFNGVPTRSYIRAQDLSEGISRGPYGDDVVYTGHSLGGGLATAAALTAGREAVGFNAAALSPETADALGISTTAADQDILVIAVEGDLVTTSQDTPWMVNPPWMQPDGESDYPIRYDSNPAPGLRYHLPPPPSGSSNTSSIPGVRLIKHHLTKALVETLDNVLLRQCGP